MPASDAVLSWNLIGAEFGLRTRLGHREWVTGLDGDPRSLPAFMGSLADGSADRLFAATFSGLWDVTASSTGPSRIVTFGTQTSESGFGEHTAFTDLNGGHWLLYCDEDNGYYTYHEAGGAWVKVVQNDVSPGAGEIGGVDPASFVSVVSFQHRNWFVQKDSQAAWYTDLDSLYGTVTRFNFGAHFPHGGDLRSLAVWTNGEGGPQTRLVAVSGGGDVVIYEGTDPTSAATFGIVGTWYAGSVPAGRRLTTNMGGDVAVMSSMGILPLSKLVQGNPIVDRTQYATVKVANLFNQLQAQTSNLRGWAMRLHPQDAALMVLIPIAANQNAEQLVMSLTTRGWHRYRGLPMGVCAEPWGGTLYFGSGDGSGRVLVNDGYLDGVTLADPSSYSAIDFSGLSAFSDLGTAEQKQVQRIEIRTLSEGGAVNLNAEARYGFDFTEAPLPAVVASSSGPLWDVGLWDEAQWEGSYVPQTNVFGAWGMGREVAVAFRGSATSRITITDLYAWFEAGAGS
jgi:hypothetical protein